MQLTTIFSREIKNSSHIHKSYVCVGGSMQKVALTMQKVRTDSLQLALFIKTKTSDLPEKFVHCGIKSRFQYLGIIGTFLIHRVSRKPIRFG